MNRTNTVWGEPSTADLPHGATTMRVAAVQTPAAESVLSGLQRAEPLVKDAASQGAELVLLPELMAVRYVFTEEMWDSAEPAHGPTRRVAQGHRPHASDLGRHQLPPGLERPQRRGPHRTDRGGYPPLHRLRGVRQRAARVRSHRLGLERRTLPRSGRSRDLWHWRARPAPARLGPRQTR